MLATATTTTLLGMEAHLVQVEVESCRGVPFFDLVGMAETSVRESRTRVRSALAQLGIELDELRIIVSLAPGDLKKSGSSFDLAIACAVLAALKVIPQAALCDTLLLGELSLTGELRPVRGVLPQTIFARKRGLCRVIVPVDNGTEAAVVGGIDARVAMSLDDVVAAFAGNRELEEAPLPSGAEDLFESPLDLADVRGQEVARRAIEIAAAGHHHLMLLGPPGGGKTMLAQRLSTVLPPLSHEEALEVSAIHSVAGLLPRDRGLLTQRPYRAPHHTVSDAGLVGGGFPPRPGELSLAHHGVLFLDELPEFRRNTLETLRQPLEDGQLTIARAQGTASFPARPLVVAACNPCPCGYHGDGSERCVCSIERVRTYRSRMSGPLVDRIDLHVILPPVKVLDLTQGHRGEPSQKVRERVMTARARQRARFERREVSAPLNGRLGARDLEVACKLDDSTTRLLSSALERLGLTARAYGKVLKVSRTLADLAGSDRIDATHVLEALSFRALDRRSMVDAA
ncbi:MAG: YifB family Mg chelatase-like AAA ATPase [Polyangiaceae bacterium]